MLWRRRLFRDGTRAANQSSGADHVPMHLLIRVGVVPDQALQQVIEGCGAAFRACVTPGVRALLLRTLLHPNRFARETAYHTLAALFALSAGPALLAWGEPAAARLQDGLSENWSQVGLGVPFPGCELH